MSHDFLQLWYLKNILISKLQWTCDLGCEQYLDKQII
jgi:hypothetical protein